MFKLVLFAGILLTLGTVLGSAVGFVFKSISAKFTDLSLGFSAGVMLAASIVGLILPSMEYGNKFVVLISLTSVIVGATTLKLIDCFVPHIHGLAGIENDGKSVPKTRLNKIILFVIAIAIHNFPEGAAAGIGFATDDVEQAMLLAGGIALQNIPEAIVIIAPMLHAGISKTKTFFVAASTGLIELFGTLLSFWLVTIIPSILPFAMSFSGGMLLYLINDEMLPETHAHGSEKSVTTALLVGFCLMLLLDCYIG